MTRPRASPRDGFSLLEVLVASVAASILALAAGTMLVLAWHSWNALQEGIEMQRDASIALATLRSRLRTATDDEVAITNGWLTINEVAFYRQGPDLVYDPDINVGGNEINMIAGRLVSFVPALTNQSGRVTITLTLSLTGDVGHDTTDITTTVALRN